MHKPTKRKAFKFLSSYYDVLNKLKDDVDKLAFLMAVINKQFLDEDPEGLNFIVNMCYQSQKHHIENSSNGWKASIDQQLEEGIKSKKRRRTKNKKHRKEIYEKYNFSCNYCGLKFDKPPGWDGVSAIHNGQMFLEIDHIKPLAKGGSDEIDNKQALCQSCNNKKSDKYE